MLTFSKLKNILSEELTPDQREHFNSIKRDPNAVAATAHFFGKGNDVVSKELEAYFEESVQKTAHFFDVDETLFAHDPKKLRIHVRDSNGNIVKSLSNQQFNKNKLNPGERYDFKDFKSSKKFASTAKPIPKMINLLNRLKNSGHNTSILTARSDLDDKQKFAHTMKKYGIDISKTHVYRAGNVEGTSTGDRKRKVLSDLIKKHGYNEIHLYDDDLGNHEHFAKLKEDHPGVRLYSHIVTHNDHTGQTTIKTIRHQ